MSLGKRALILSSVLLFSLVFRPVSGAKELRFITLKGGNINTILGASREPHTMTSLKEQGASAEYVNKDLGEISVNEGPCAFIAMQAQPAPDALYEVFVECFDLAAERESKSFSYAADSTGKVIRSGSLTPVGEYAMGDPHFDVAAWNWILKHVSSKLKHKVEAARIQGGTSLPSPLYKVICPVTITARA